MSAWRHVRAILLLPVVVTLVVPALVLWWTRSANVGWGLPGGLAALPVSAGVALIGAGVALVVWTVSLFIAHGEGTLAPWDPTSRLVLRGPYRHVRHPMIGGVACTLLGEAVLLGSVPLLVWFALAVGINALYLPLVEERGLARRFGDDWAAYRANVPRYFPRRTQWDPPA
jgi:protein-S-isoprenylcysteine O-methyltransferase Ste14